MKILHILNDGPDNLSSEIIALQAHDHELTVVDLTAPKLSYEEIVAAIFAHDRVISW